MPQHRERSADDFRDVCFVIMPFGIKTVGTGDEARDVNFDAVYAELFEPAISAVRLPADEGGGHLRPVRTDREFHTGHISQEMFEYIEYSRFALADISSVNANVFYELGARHRAHESGTAIFRHGNAAIPFDINQIKAFPYTVDPVENIGESRKLVTTVLTNSLERNAWDSPIMLALRNQRDAPDDLQDVLLKAENAVRAGAFNEAHQHWLKAGELEPANPLHDIKASAYPKAEGDWDTAIGLLNSALAKEATFGEARAESTYSDAYRELGIAQNKKDKKIFPRAGEESLRRAIHYAPEDFDAWASLGGVLRRADDDAGALAAYEMAVEVSDGHPYPLLMAIKLRAKVAGAWDLDMKTTMRLGKAMGFRSAQVEGDPPIDVPWSFFDLAEIYLFMNEAERALETAKRGLALSTADWMPGTFLSALEMLPEVEALSRVNELKAAVQARKKELSRG
jgi:tetratricopeptide (TPR) repeat protein